MRYVLFLAILSLFSLTGLFNPSSIFALNPQQTAELALSDANSECPYLYRDYDVSTWEIATIEIKIKQKAQSVYNAKGYQNSAVPWITWNDHFVSICKDIISEYNRQVGGLTSNVGLPSGSYYNLMIEMGSKNADCKQDGINDAKNNKPKTQPNRLVVEGRMILDKNTIPEVSELTNETYDVLLDGFYQGCKKAYELGYDMIKTASVNSDTVSPYKLGFKDGTNDSQCRNEGVDDYEKENPRELDLLSVATRQVNSNPYNPLNPLALDEIEDFNNYRIGYEDGCKTTYNSAYDTAKRKSTTGGSLFDDDDLGGCLIATAAYGTELAPEVQNLREIRNKMYETKTGGEVMHAVNDFYYSFSPTVSDWERESPIFREVVKILITPSMASFTILDHHSINTEEGLIGYVIGAVFLNVGMYFIAPFVVVHQIKKRI
jgi:hypothetical protein